MKALKLVLLGLLSIGSVFAADIDTAQSTLEWKASKVSGKHNGKVPFKSGSLEMKDGKVISGEFVANISDFTVTDLSGKWATKFINHMKSDAFFDTKKHPIATLKITSVKGNKATGDLTIKGKTNKITFPMKKSGKTYSGEFTFDRTKFDMIYGSKNFFQNLGDKAIDNEVTLNYTLVLK